MFNGTDRRQGQRRGPRADRPLVVRCGAFGDMVLIMPLIRALADRFGCEVDVLTSGPWSDPLLRGQPGVGEIYSVRSRKTPYWLSADQRRVVGLLRARGAGPTWYCDGNEAARSLVRRAGIGDHLTVDVKDHPLLPGEHATQQWLRLAALLPEAVQRWEVRSVGAAAAPAGGSRLEVSERQRADVKAWLRLRELQSAPLIAIQAGNKRTLRRGFKRLAANHKYWPQERWAEVLRHLRARHPLHAVLLLGAGPEYRLNQEIMTLAGGERLFNVADDLPVPRLVALLARVEGLITVDSGPAHVAAAVGCPQVVLFGRASPSLYRPWGAAGPDVKLLTGQHEGEPSMLGIAASEVVAAWDTLRMRHV